MSPISSPLSRTTGYRWADLPGALRSPCGRPQWTLSAPERCRCWSAPMSPRAGSMSPTSRWSCTWGFLIRPRTSRTARAEPGAGTGRRVSSSRSSRRRKTHAYKSSPTPRGCRSTGPAAPARWPGNCVRPTSYGALPPQSRRPRHATRNRGMRVPGIPPESGREPRGRTAGARVDSRARSVGAGSVVGTPGVGADNFVGTS